MKKMNLLNYVKTNKETLYSVFNNTFELTEIEFNEVIFQLLSIDYERDPFYSSLYQNETFYECFNVENLTNLRNYLMQIGLDDVNLKRVINDVPEVILLSSKIDCIYPLFKCDNFKGIALLQGDSFKSFMLPNIIDFYKVKRFRDYDLNIEYERLIRLEYFNQYENKDTVNSLIGTLTKAETMI